jgi:hypothetical protein
MTPESEKGPGLMAAELKITTKELLSRICDASDGGVPKVAIFRPAITRARRAKTGVTTIQLMVKTDEFSPNDLLEDGLWACLAIGTCAQIQRLMRDADMGRAKEPA